MSSTEAVMLVVFTLVAYFGSSIWKHWIDNLKVIKEKELDNLKSIEDNKITKDAQKDILDTLSEMTKNTVETLERVAAQNSKAESIYSKSKDVKSDILKSTRYADKVKIEGVSEMTGDEAEYIAKSPKKDWEPVRLDGLYRLLEVNSSSTLKRKVKIRNLDTHRELTAILEDQTLEKRHNEQLGKAEWNHHPAFLEIKAKMKGDSIKDAVIISVQKIEEDIVFDDSMDLNDN